LGCGILLLDKPLGLSSNRALQRVRRAFGGAKAGHTGSLDPLASGMLPICIGEATKLAGCLLAGRKRYRFTVRLGERTSTGDAEGEIIERAPVPHLDQEAVQAVLAALSGPQMQVPPMYSALKREGQPLYKLARQGLEVERAARAIDISALQWLGSAADSLELAVECSKGTYVRVLAEQIAVGLGSCGHVTALRREWVEPFVTEPMVALEALEAGPPPALLPPERAVDYLPAVHLDALATRAIRHGQSVSLPQAPAGGSVQLFDAQGQFFGLGQLQGAELKVQRLFAE
jgi:tRNA pseudouridine55 synthase